MSKKIKIIFFILLIPVAIFATKVLLEYQQFKKVVEAAATMPTTDAGTVATYIPVCTAVPPSGVCTNCPSCGPKTGNYVCAGYSEITLSAQKGTTEICPTKAFVYSGGGAMPSVGSHIIYGGASNVFPWVIGVPGLSLNKTQKALDFFKTFISGNKEQ